MVRSIPARLVRSGRPVVAASIALVGLVALLGALSTGHLTAFGHPGGGAGAWAFGAAPLLGFLAFASPTGFTLPCWAATHHVREGHGRRTVTTILSDWVRVRF
jgi:hypothetical protein